MIDVLVIDDDEAALKLTERFLQDADYRTLKARGGEEGLAVFKKYRPPVVITDVKMPGMDGLEVLKRIKGRQADCIVIVMTAHGSEDIAAEAIRWGASNYLRKPFSSSDMLITLHRYRNLIQERRLAHLAPRFVERQRLELNLATDPDEVASAGQFLAKRVRMFVRDPEDLMALRFSITEMLTNAFEHGNLGIDYAEKKRAFDTESWDELLAERLRDPALAARRIQVWLDMNRFGMTCVIEDEGDGFDWRSVPNPFEPENMHLDGGRGIHMTMQYVDDLTYDLDGRRVTLRSKFRHKNGANGDSKA